MTKQVCPNCTKADDCLDYREAAPVRTALLAALPAEGGE